MSKRSDLKEAVKFINKVGGISYYENLNVDSLSDFEVFKEIADIQDLFKTWLDEFKWNSKEDLLFMKRILSMSRVTVNNILDNLLNSEQYLNDYLKNEKNLIYLRVIGDIELASFKSTLNSNNNISLLLSYSEKGLNFKIVKGKNHSIKQFNDVIIAFNCFKLFVTGANKLYYIKTDSKNLVIYDEIKIAERTEYSFKLEDNPCSIKSVNIGELPYYRVNDYCVITTDLNLGISMWNKEWKEQIEKVEEHLNKIKCYIIK